MLERLLTHIRQGGTLETSVLAAQLDTTPQLIASMLEHLHRLGLVRDYVDCSEGCAGCSLKSGCQHKQPVRLWQSS